MKLKILLATLALTLPATSQPPTQAPLLNTEIGPLAHHTGNPPPRRTQRFFEPRNPRSGIRLDVCLDFARHCYRPAADQFCHSKGFQRAERWWVEEGRGRSFQTQTVRSKQICNGPGCDAFLAIDCTGGRPARR